MEGISYIIRGYGILFAAHGTRNHPDIQAALRALAHAIRTCLPAGEEAVSAGQIALNNHMQGQVEPTFGAIAHCVGTFPLIERWVRVYRANKHNCQCLNLLQFYDGTLPGVVLNAFTAARSAKGVFSDSATVEFPTTWGTMNKTAFSWAEASRVHRERILGRDANYVEEGCAVARSSAQICLWHDIIFRDSYVACERDGSCEVRWFPSPWRWDDPGQDSETGEVRPTLVVAGDTLVETVS